MPGSVSKVYSEIVFATRYKAGGHPKGLDSEHAHKVSLVYDDNGVGYVQTVA